MSAMVADTHAIVWFIQKSPRLSAPALAAMQAAINGNFGVFISAITLVELIYLEEKGSVPVSVRQAILQFAQSARAGLAIVSFDAACAATLATIPRSDIPDMPDRMIAATALTLGLPLVTKDHKIHLSSLTTIW